MTIVNIPWADEARLPEILKDHSFQDYFLYNVTVDRLCREGAPKVNIVVDAATATQLWERFESELDALAAAAPGPAAPTPHLKVTQAINHLSKECYRRCQRLLVQHPGRNFRDIAWPTDLHFVSPHKNYQSVKRLGKYIQQTYKGADVLCEMLVAPQPHAVTTAEALDIYKHFAKDIAREVNIAAYEKKHPFDEYHYFAVNDAVHKIITRIYHRHEKEIMAAPEKTLTEIIANSRFDKRVRALWEL